MLISWPSLRSMVFTTLTGLQEASMNSLDRVAAAVRFEPPDRIPVIAQVFGHAATLAGVALCDYVQDGELLVRCQMRVLERYGYDAVFALMDVNVETGALGSVLT